VTRGAQALLGLAPFLVLSTAVLLQMPAQMQDLHADMTGLQLTQGLSEAGYAFGVVVPAYLVRRVPSRSLYLVCTTLLAVGSFIAAGAGEIVTFIVGAPCRGSSRASCWWWRCRR
jgi:hypothetical protein